MALSTSVVSLNCHDNFLREIGCALQREPSPSMGEGWVGGGVGWGWSCRSITAETKGIRSPEAPLCTKKKILYLRSRARQRAEVYGARMPAATTFERASPPPNPPPSRGRALLCRDMQGFLRDTTLATRRHSTWGIRWCRGRAGGRRRRRAVERRKSGRSRLVART